MTNKPCRKKPYPDKLTAQLALATLTRQDKPDHTETRTYHCPQCHKWHLTSQPKRKSRKGNQ